MKKLMKNKKVMFIIAALVLAVALLPSGVIANPPTGSGDPPVVIASPAAGSGDTPVAAKINYQGQLTDNAGNPLNGSYDMEFGLWDSVSGGIQVYGPIIMSGVNVTNGLFSVKLDVGQGVFNGQGLWLEVIVGGETLSPRQEILPVPYALSLKPGAEIVGTCDNGNVLWVQNNSNTTDAIGLVGISVNGIGVGGGAFGNGTGVYGVSMSGTGVTGISYSGGAAISAQGTGRIESTAKSYIWVGGTAFQTSEATLTFEYWWTGAIRVTSAATGDKYIKTTITVPAVLYGQNVTVEQLRVNYCCDNAASYIAQTWLVVQTGATAGNTLVNDLTHRTDMSNTANYILDTSGSNELNADYGVLCLQLELHFANTAHSIYISGVRLTLSHSG